MSEGNSNIYVEHDKHGQAKNRLEIYNTLILAIATLAITWCSYQSVLWNGIQTFKLADVNKYTRQAQEIMIKVEQHKVMDADLIRGFVQDVWEKKQDKIDFYINRVRPEMTTILQAWVNLNPLENTKAPPHPMAMEEYKKLIQHELDKAEQFRTKAEESAHNAHQANLHSDNFSLYTVVFSMVMFLGAIASKARKIKISFTLTVLSGMICIVALILLLINMPLASKQ